MPIFMHEKYTFGVPFAVPEKHMIEQEKGCNPKVTASFVICVVFYLFIFSIASASALLNLEAITMRIKQSATKM